MVTAAEYALIAANVYRNGRSPENVVPLPSGWVEAAYVDDRSSGFTGGVYRDAATNEIVIAFKGTDLQAGDIVTDGALSLGIPTRQIVQAALLYAQVRAENPNATITFTGHSLGGGIASIMTALFDRPATLFATAGFEAAARNPALALLVRETLAANGFSDPALDAYLRNPGLFGDRERTATHYYIEGEVLVPTRVFLPGVYGSETKIDIGNQDLSPVQRHGIDLHAALLLEPKLQRAAQALPQLLGILQNGDLYANDPIAPGQKTLSRLLQGQTSDNLLSDFADDALRLVQGGTIGTKLVREAFILGTIEHYRGPQAAAGAAIATGSNFLEIDVDVGESPLSSPARQRMQKALLELTDNHPGARLPDSVNAKDRWIVQAGDGALDLDAAGEARDIILGGSGADRVDAGAGDDLVWGGDGADTLAGGDGNDLLLGANGNDRLEGGDGNDALDGGRGDDVLIGGAGDDVLAGGRGNDTYVFHRGDGRDLILEVDKPAGSVDTLVFSDLTLADLWFRRVGQSMEIGVRGSGDAVTINEWYRGANYHVEFLRTEDGAITANQMESLVAAMASFAPAADGAATAAPATASQEYVIAANGTLA